MSTRSQKADMSLNSSVHLLELNGDDFWDNKKGSRLHTCEKMHSKALRKFSSDVFTSLGIV